MPQRPSRQRLSSNALGSPVLQHRLGDQIPGYWPTYRDLSASMSALAVIWHLPNMKLSLRVLPTPAFLFTQPVLALQSKQSSRNNLSAFQCTKTLSRSRN